MAGLMISGAFSLHYKQTWAFSTAGQPSAPSDTFWPETGLAGWLLSVGVLSPGISPISLGFDSKLGDLSYKGENYSVVIVQLT